MDARSKRAALFEYYKKLGNPKWVLSDGQRLFDTLADLPDTKVEAMYERMIELEGLKQKQEALASKEQKMRNGNTWRSRLPLFLIWVAAGLSMVFGKDPSPGIAMVDGVVAGMYLAELLEVLVKEYRKSDKVAE